MAGTAFTIGVDYGTNSVRAVVVDTRNGRTVGTKVFTYPSGHQGILLDKKDPNVARQNPADYVAGLEQSVRGALAQARTVRGFAPGKVIAIGVDTTGSTPIPVDRNNRALASLPRFRNNLAAMAWLWKDHTSVAEAAEITALARKMRPQFLAKCGGTYSSEWFWAKVLHCKRTAPAVFEAAWSWVECADWLPALLAGVTDPMAIKPGICPAGHKAMYSDEWGGYPDSDFLSRLDPALVRVREQRPAKACDATTPAGALCTEWAKKLGLPVGIPIAIGAFDAHTGGIGAGVRPAILVKVIGTSTCDMSVAPLASRLADIPGICGIVPGSILPGHYGLEAGQSAVGDIFKWFVEGVCKGGDKLHAELTAEAARLKPGQSGLLALDWNNGNRTILVDQRLSGVLLGQTLHSSRAEIYRALIEATAFGARAIVERFKEYGVPIESVICTGGIAEKNPVLMQIYADVLNCPMKTSASSQTCALGSAIAAAVLAGPSTGGHSSFDQARDAMTSVKKRVFQPKPAAVEVYNRLYALYRRLHDGFGGVVQSSELGSVMKELITIREQQST